MNEQETARVLSRVRKMMAIANDGAATEGERDNAMRMAHATLAKHNLTMIEAEAAGAEQQEARDVGGTTSRDQPWCRSVANSVSKLFFTYYFFQRSHTRGKVEHKFVGRLSNVETAREITDYVIKSITAEANRRWKQQPDPGPWWTQFCKGAALSVAARCTQLRADADKTEGDGKGTSLVLASHYAAELEANKKHIADVLEMKLKFGKDRQRHTAGSGYADGREFGAKVGLDRQIGAAKKPTYKQLN